MASRITSQPTTDGGTQDSLDGIPIQDGETLAIRWPGGSIQQIAVSVVHFSRGLVVDGEVRTVLCSKAYMALPVYGGSSARLPLSGFLAQRVV